MTIEKQNLLVILYIYFIYIHSLFTLYTLLYNKQNTTRCNLDHNFHASGHDTNAIILSLQVHCHCIRHFPVSSLLTTYN